MDRLARKIVTADYQFSFTGVIQKHKQNRSSQNIAALGVPGERPELLFGCLFPMAQIDRPKMY